MSDSFKQYKIYYSVALRMTPLLVRQLNKIGDSKIIVLNYDRDNNLNHCIIQLDWLSKTIDIGNPSIAIENILAPLTLFGDNLYFKPEMHSINNAGKEMPDEIIKMFAGPVKLDINTLNSYFQDINNKLNEIKRSDIEIYQTLIKALKLINAAKIIERIDINISYALLVSVIESLTCFLELEPKFALKTDLAKLAQTIEQILGNNLAENDIAEIEKILSPLNKKLGERFINVILENIPADYNSKYGAPKEMAIDLKDVPELRKHLKEIYSSRSKFLHAGFEFPKEASIKIPGILKMKMTPSGFGIPLSDADIYAELNAAHQRYYSKKRKNDVPSIDWFEDIVIVVMFSIIDKQFRNN